MTTDTDPSMEEFWELFGREDELGVVVRAHIHIEFLVRQFIDEHVVASDSIEKMELEYRQIVQLAIALGMDASLEGPLKALGTIRNKFAHQKNARLTNELTTNFYKTLDGQLKEYVHIAFDSLKKGFEKDLKVDILGFSMQDPKIQFEVMMVALHAVLKSVVKRSNKQGEPDPVA